ncbi:MAG: peptidoglycan DD-metalloendopeptidase family protein [Polyangiaceae bacterium]|nr:peptidoglycan DD-metalloendopeptidase family protein [Polyangiaceae bacterium]
MKRTSSCLLGLGLGLLYAGSAGATPQLAAPWPCGVTYSVTQGHNTGSHTAEGAYAWDIGIGLGGEVSAPADGTVRMIRMDSSSYGCDSAYANDANYVIIAFGDGTEALFLHLQAGSSSLSVGQSVKRGDVVGRVGNSGWICGTHLHFQIQQSCGSWWCQSLPSTFQNFGDPSLGTNITSDNCGPPPSCDARLNGSELVIDESDSACFERATSYWWDVAEGYGDHHYYTFTTDAVDEETYGRWHFHVDAAGDYELSVHIPNSEASSQNAVYDVFDGAGITSSPSVNQAAQKGWVSLGVYSLTQGDDRYVSLGDNTGENYDSLMRKLSFDAVRWTPAGSGNGGAGGAGAQGGTAGASNGGSNSSTGGAANGGAAGSAGSWPGGGSGADSSGGAGAAGSAGAGFNPATSTSDGDSGCACRLTPNDAPRQSPSALFALFGLLLLRRRRSPRSALGPSQS